MNRTLSTGTHWRGGVSLALLVVMTIVITHIALAHPPTPTSSPEAAIAPLPTAQLASTDVDLVVGPMSINPPDPAPGEPVTITTIITNTGTSDMDLTAGFFVHLYINPTEQPPEQATDHTHLVRSIALRAGKTLTYEYETDEMSLSQCNTIFVWVDRDNEIEEDKENNNLGSTFFGLCSSECPEDTHEPDNSCAQAPLLPIDSTSQQHTFCPSNDEDWYRFEAIGGNTYEVKAQNTEINADALLELYSSCESQGSFGGGTTIRFEAPTTQTYYIKASNGKANATFLTGYAIAIEEITACAGYHEPNNSQATATDIFLNEQQTHTFCTTDDTDWLRFEAQPGKKYAIEAEPVGDAADPKVDMHINILSDDDAAGITLDPLSFSAPTSTIFSIEITNNNPSASGQATEYTISVLPKDDDSADIYEPDNSANQAKTLIVNNNPVTHTLSPLGDSDWMAFQATAGLSYTIETVGLGTHADTIICLYSSNEQELLCDDENGANDGSRIGAWQAPTDGRYFIQAYHAAPSSTAGEETRYAINVVEGRCKADQYEPDNAIRNAKPLSLDSIPTTHTSCLANSATEGDRDWSILTIPSAGEYTIQSTSLWPGSDTLLILYDTDGTTELANNDDYGTGGASKIIHTFTESGTYYVESRQFNPTKYGESTRYQLSAFANASDPTPTPTPQPPTPTPQPPTPTPTPQPSDIEAVFLTNREQLEVHYGQARTDELMTNLTAFANTVQGEIVLLENNNTVAAAYAEWNQNQTSIAHANATANAIRQVLMTYLNEHPTIESVVLVGDDRIIPFRRIPDATGYPEETYDSVAADTTVGSALAANTYLSDDYYVDSEPVIENGRQVYIPDWPIGRVLETPEHISAMLQTHTTSPQTQVNHILVVGYDFVKDVATNICSLYSQDIPDINKDCSLIGESWSASQYRDRQLNADPPFKFQSFNGHAYHGGQGAPTGGLVSASDILDSDTTNLSGAIIYSVGCHAGLNVPDPSDDAQEPDLPQAFNAKQAWYVANTGYGWGNHEGMGLSERFMHTFTYELLRGTSTSVGQALMKTKQRYYNESYGFDEYDEKVMQQVTLYGLPLYTVITGGAFSDDPYDDPYGLGGEDAFPSVNIDLPMPHAGSLGPDNTAISGTLRINVRYTLEDTAQVQSTLAQSASGYQPKTTAWGTYYALDGHTTAHSHGPVLPHMYVDMDSSSNQQLRGVVLTSATYSTTSTIDPVIDAPVNEYTPTDEEPSLATTGIYPLIPFTLQTNEHVERNNATLAMAMGQYDSNSNTQTLYDNMQYDVYYSASDDTTGPEVTLVDGFHNTVHKQAYFKVEANDENTDVARVMVSYAQSNSNWGALDLAYTDTAHKWQWNGNPDPVKEASYYVQSVDNAGNTTITSRKQGYFTVEGGAFIAEQDNPPQPTPTPTPTITPPVGTSVYLPLVRR